MVVDGLKAEKKDPKTASVVCMSGDPTDGNAAFFKAGALKTMGAAGIKCAFSPKGTWDATKSGTEFQQAYTALKGNIDAVWTANDANNAAVITVLNKYGKTVPTSGQDASIAGLQNILLGKQYGTVYKPYQLEAKQASDIAIALLKGQKPTAPTTQDGVPAFLRRRSPRTPTRSRRSSPTATRPPPRSAPATSLPPAPSTASSSRHPHDPRVSLRLPVTSGAAGTSAVIGRIDPTADADAEGGGMVAPIIELKDIRKSFGPADVLKGVNLKVYPGQVSALVGDNGAGKSTLIKGLAGVQAYDSGDVLVDGEPVHLALPVRRVEARHRGRLPGPRALREPRHRPEHVPRPRGDRAGHARQRRHGEARLRDARLPLGPHDEVGPAEGLVPLRRAAADGRDRPRGAAEGAGRHPRRADRRARRRADGAGAEPRPSARRPGRRRADHQPQPRRRLQGRRPHQRAVPGHDGRAAGDEGHDEQRRHRVHHRPEDRRAEPRRSGR